MECSRPIRPKSWAILVVALSLVIWWLLFPSWASADGPDPGRPKPEPNEPPAHVDVHVVSRPDGVYVEISVHQSSPGSKITASPTPPSPRSGRNQPTSSTGASPGSSGAAHSSDRIWSDETGFYDQSADGHLYYLTVPNIGSQSDIGAQLSQHPNQTPYTLYIDNQFQGIVWIPSNPTSVHIGPPPVQAAIPPNPPAGDGNSTDPYQVALDLLDHVPLPNILLKMNPALGLVHLPGWFWVEGYDGKPFGMSRTVTIPPAIGPEVPFTQVPANDPRRQGTAFTVSVRIWPARYEWSFGDGATLGSNSLGKAYPAESDIQHTYDSSSLKFHDGFPIQLAVIFNAEYQVNGGTPQGLPPISHVYTASYPVQEAQAVLTGH